MMRRWIILGIELGFVLASTSIGAFAQTRQRPAATPPQVRPVQRLPRVQPPPPLPPDRREDVRDRREDVRDRREDVRDRREDVRDRREDVRDRRIDGGRVDRLEDVRDRREDVRDRREDVRDRREDVRDRIEDRLDRHPAFAARVRSLLPPDVSPSDAMRGFRNERQFIAALHASQNLNIPFADLKARMTAGSDTSLGSAIHDLRPDMSETAIRDAVAAAEAQAEATAKLAAD